MSIKSKIYSAGAWLGERAIGWVMDRVEKINSKKRHKEYVASNARFAIGIDRPTSNDLDIVLERGRADGLAWIICYDKNRKRREIAWRKLKQVDYNTQPRAFGEPNALVSRRILDWISMEAKDKNIAREAESMLPKEGPWSRP